MKREKLKPNIEGYEQVSIHDPYVDFSCFNKEEMKLISLENFRLWGVKSKFRPVYSGVSYD